MNHPLPLESSLRMTSLQVQKLTKKRHDHILRDIDQLIEKLSESDDSNMGSEIIPIFEYGTYKSRGKEYKLVSMDETAALLLVSGYNVSLRLMIIQEWQIYRKAFNDHNWCDNDKEVQKRVMSVIHATLDNAAKLDYMKANVVVNKAVSNLYGFDKMVKKGDMSRPMLDDRQKILKDFETLFKVVQDYTAIKNIIYDKYSQKLLK